MLIAIDIGNSSINIGFFIGEHLIVHKMDSYPMMSSSGYSRIFRQILMENGIDKTPEGSIISSVIPGHTESLKTACAEFTGKQPLMVSTRIVNWFSFAVDSPDELGGDRVSASVGASELFGIPIVVLDFGTATTVNFIGGLRPMQKEGQKPGKILRGLRPLYKGGAILPGIGLMIDALKRGTAKLPEIVVEKPRSAVGKNTSGSMLAGVIYGSAGAVERIISDVEEMESEKYKVVLTGGYSKLMSGFLKGFDFIEPFLTLKGMKFIYEKNK